MSNKKQQLSNNNDLELLEKLKSGMNELPKASLTQENRLYKKITLGMQIQKIEVDKLIEAPTEWNFYKTLNKNKMFELIESIVENGLLSPIIIWQQENGQYMILAGHNRVRAFKMVYNKTKEDKYLTIDAYVKSFNELSEEEARTIIIDTNFVQRQMSTYEKHKSIMFKYNVLGRKSRKEKGKQTAELIADEFGISRSHVFRYIKLNNLIDELMKLIDDEVITIKAGMVLANLPAEVQKKLYDEHIELLNNKNIRNLKISKSIKDIAEIYDDIIKQLSNNLSITHDVDYEDLIIKVPNKYIQNFEEFLHKWEFYNELMIE